MIEMTRRLNKIEEKVKTYLRQRLLIESGMHVCVCYSGGLDSAVLLDMLYRMRDELQICLSACHFNHMIRGAEADRDEQFCRQICARLDIPFYCGKADVIALHKERKISLEEAGREARYAWFDELALEQGIDRLATAHHKNDQAETVLFRLIRGTTVSGLAGIPHTRDRFIRPLLCLSRNEIDTYAKEQMIAYQTDSTNLSENYTRNYLRHTVIPAIEQINPSAVDAISRLTEYAHEDNALILSLLPQYAEVQNVSGLPMPIIRRTVARNFGRFSNQTLCYQHLDAICNALYTNTDTKIGLPDGIFAIIEHGCFYFEKNFPDLVPTLEDGFLSEGVTYYCDGRLRIIFCKNDSDTIRYFYSQCYDKKVIVYNLSTEIPLSFERIYGMIRYRSRQQGDRMLLHGVNRSVKKMISENKIPVHLRELIPIFYDDRGILCIPFVAVSDRAYSAHEHAEYILRVDIFDEHARKVVEDL